MAIKDVRWKRASAQEHLIELGGVSLAITELETRPEDGSFGVFTLRRELHPGPFLEGVADDLGVTTGRASPEPPPTLEGVEGGIWTEECRRGALDCKLTIERPCPEPVEVYLQIREGVATFSSKDETYDLPVVDALCRGLRDGSAWEPAAARADARPPAALDFEQLVVRLTTDRDRDWDEISAWMTREPDAARAHIAPLRAEMDRVRVARRPTRARALLLTGGVAFLERIDHPAYSQELVRCLGDPDEFVRRDARFSVERALRRDALIDRAACIAELDRFVAKLNAPRAELEASIELSKTLATRK